MDVILLTLQVVHGTLLTSNCNTRIGDCHNDGDNYYPFTLLLIRCDITSCVLEVFSQCEGPETESERKALSCVNSAKIH
jgi:hypothetical protein